MSRKYPQYPGLLEDKNRWRVRVEGNRNKKILIPMGPEEPGFKDYYDAARLGYKYLVVEVARPKKGTLDRLCEEYIAWLEEQVAAGNYSKLTLDGRRGVLKQACNFLDDQGDRMGSLDADLPEDAFVYIQDRFGRRTGAADTCLKALRAAYRWGKKRGYPKRSPVFEIEKIHKSRGGAKPWTASDVKKFLKRHGPGTMARLWFWLAYNTLGRIGDAPRLGPHHEEIVDGIRCLTWQPQKRGSKEVTVPILPYLAVELDRHGRRTGPYLLTAYGRPFASSGSLDNRVRKWIIQAGLVDDNGQAARSQHGIRKGVATLIANEGATQYELMSTMSHSEAKTSEVYTEKVERRELAATAIGRIAHVSYENDGPKGSARHPQDPEELKETTSKNWQPVAAERRGLASLAIGRIAHVAYEDEGEAQVPVDVRESSQPPEWKAIRVPSASTSRAQSGGLADLARGAIQNSQPRPQGIHQSVARIMKPGDLVVDIGEGRERAADPEGGQLGMAQGMKPQVGEPRLPTKIAGFVSQAFQELRPILGDKGEAQIPLVAVDGDPARRGG